MSRDQPIQQKSFRAQLSDDMTTRCRAVCSIVETRGMKRVERDRHKFLDQVLAAEREISKTCGQLRSSHRRSAEDVDGKNLMLLKQRD